MAKYQKVKNTIQEYKSDSAAIINALANIQASRGAKKKRPAYLSLPMIRQYQKYVFDRFSGIINMATVEYVSKTRNGWLIVGDNRSEIAAKISLVIERFGIGVGMLVLHAQQMNSGHIPVRIKNDGVYVDLSQPTQNLYGARNERVLNVPVRRIRTDNAKLAKLSIMKPEGIWDQSQIVKHKGDQYDCRYCSAGEMNPLEVVVNIRGSRFGLSRSYNLGFTFAPFGNPLLVVHFLAWDRAEKPLNMNRTPITVSDLVVLTRLINLSIVNFFAGTGIDDFPVIDGVSNGWAGNSIYHQHFQFFQPEFSPPIESEHLVTRQAMLRRDDVEIRRLSWKVPIYKIIAEESINVGLVGNDLAGIWRLLSDVVMIGPDADSPDGYQAEEETEMRFHTQNLYVPGEQAGKVAYVVLRDRRLIDYKPENVFVNKKKNRLAQSKKNIAILEATGIMIVDDLKSFAEISSWEPADISEQIDKLAETICPKEKKVDAFERSIKGLYPPE